MYKRQTLERAGNICVRNEAEADHRTVENVIRRAFWNLYVPGCAEHYVAHVMRPHGDFVPELDLVLERDGQIIGSIMSVSYTHLQPSPRPRF